jgi:glycosyltransferase involved in cell wall biosynthesis
MVSEASRRIEVLQIQTQAEAAGAQRVSDVVAEGLRAKGYGVRTAFMYRKTAAYDDDPYAIFVSPAEASSFLGRLKIALRLIKLVKSEKPRALITYQHYGNIVGGLAGWLSSTSVIIANQSGNPGKQGLRRLLSWLDEVFGVLGIYDFIVVNSASTESAYRKLSRRYSKRLVRIDHGISMHGAHPDKQSARECFGLPPTATLLVTTGRLATGKNQDVLIKALQLLPETHLALAGAGPDRGELEHLADRLNVRNRLHFVGELSANEIPSFLKAGDIFVFASTDETFGMSVVEAAVIGLPVVTSDLPVLREVLTSDEGKPAGLFFVAGDHRDLANAVTTLADDRHKSESLMRAGRSLANRYSSERMVSEYEDLICRHVRR